MGMLKSNLVKQLRELYLLHKGIFHGDIKEIKGIDIDKWQDAAENFVVEMTRIIDITINRNNFSMILIRLLVNTVK